MEDHNIQNEVESLRIMVQQLAEQVAVLSSNRRSLSSTGAAPFSPDHGDTAWMLCATALVLFMTMPGLALYYSGMVSSKNVLSTTMQVVIRQ